MISTADFRNGLVVELDGELMQMVEFQHVKPGKGGAFVRTRFKNVRTGRVLERTFRSGERMEEAELESQTWQYLYHDGDLYHFMHKETYEQIAVGEAIAGAKQQWLRDNMDCVLTFHKGQVILMEPPMFVDLEVTQCDPGVQGDRAKSGSKPAVLETGAVVQVPLYITQGERVRVDTRTGDYIERVS